MIKLHENAELSKKQERIYIEFKNRVTGYVLGGAMYLARNAKYM